MVHGSVVLFLGESLSKMYKTVNIMHSYSVFSSDRLYIYFCFVSHPVDILKIARYL